MGSFKGYILKSIAIMPVMTAAEEMQDLFTVVGQAGSLRKLAGRVIDHFVLGFSAIKMFLNILQVVSVGLATIGYVNQEMG